jgi:hypothetical protein
LFLLSRKILCIASLRKLFLATAGAKQDGQKSGFILFAFPKHTYEKYSSSSPDLFASTVYQLWPIQAG